LFPPFHHFSTANLTVKTSPGPCGITTESERTASVGVFNGRYSSAMTLPAKTASDFLKSSETLTEMKHLAVDAGPIPPVSIAEASASACHTLSRNTSNHKEKLLFTAHCPRSLFARALGGGRFRQIFTIHRVLEPGDEHLVPALLAPE